MSNMFNGQISNLHWKYIIILYFPMVRFSNTYVWVNYNISLTWIVRPYLDDFPILSPSFPVREDSEVVMKFTQICPIQYMSQQLVPIYISNASIFQWLDYHIVQSIYPMLRCSNNPWKEIHVLSSPLLADSWPPRLMRKMPTAAVGVLGRTVKPEGKMWEIMIS